MGCVAGGTFGMKYQTSILINVSLTSQCGVAPAVGILSGQSALRKVGFRPGLTLLCTSCSAPE